MNLESSFESTSSALPFHDVLTDSALWQRDGPPGPDQRWHLWVIHFSDSFPLNSPRQCSHSDFTRPRRRLTKQSHAKSLRALLGGGLAMNAVSLWAEEVKVYSTELKLPSRRTSVARTFDFNPTFRIVVGVKCLRSRDSSSVPCATKVFPLQDIFSSFIRAEDFPSRTAFVLKVQRGRAQCSSSLSAWKQHFKVPEIAKRAEAKSKLGRLLRVGLRCDLPTFWLFSQMQAKWLTILWRRRHRRPMKASGGRQQDAMKRLQFKSRVKVLQHLDRRRDSARQH